MIQSWGLGHCLLSVMEATHFSVIGLTCEGSDETVIVHVYLVPLSYTHLFCHPEARKPGVKLILALSPERPLNCLCLASGCLTGHFNGK